MCLHCKGSKLYRAERIVTHKTQFRATMLVLLYFGKRYTKNSLARHQQRALQAMQHLEKGFSNG